MQNPDYLPTKANERDLPSTTCPCMGTGIVILPVISAATIPDTELFNNLSAQSRVRQC